MSLNTTTNGEPIQTVYVYRYDYYRRQFGGGMGLLEEPMHLTGYAACLYEPDIPEKPSKWNNNKMIEIIKVDTTRMTARPIDDYFHKILFIWSDEEFKEKYNNWREWIKRYEITN